MSDIQMIPLSRLFTHPDNVRKTVCESEMAELRASISSNGLLQSLVVIPDVGGNYLVVAGNRRLQALRQINIHNDAVSIKVPCLVMPANSNAIEISLAENVVRAAMHPADQSEAFQQLLANGQNIADIAASFGVTETVVKKRLKLANLSPVILAHYRSGRLNLEQAQAYAYSDDHKLQEKHYKDFHQDKWYMSPSDIRGYFTQDEITADDRRVRFVTIAAYEAAGGQVHRDLFAHADDEEESTIILNPALLDKLVSEKLSQLAEQAKAQGWAWVTAKPSFDWNEKSKFQQSSHKPVNVTKAHAAELKQHKQQLQELLDKDELTAEEKSTIQQSIQRVAELESKTVPDSVLAMAGTVISIGHDGMIEYHHGLIRPQDAKKAATAAEKAKSSPDKKSKSGAKSETKKEPDEKADLNSISGELLSDLTAHKRAIISYTLANQHGRTHTLAALAYALAEHVFIEDQGDYEPPLAIRMFSNVLHSLSANVADRKSSKAYAELLNLKTAWDKKLAAVKTSAQLWDYCMAADEDTILNLITFCAGLSLTSAIGTEADDLTNKLAIRAKVDMAAWFKPTLENYFSRITKPVLLAHLRDVAKGHVDKDVEKLKKDDLAALIARELPKANPNWVPAAINLPAPAVKATKPTTKKAKKG